MLELILKSFLVEDEKNDEQVFEGNGPLSTFSSKIKLTYRLGLISREEARTLDQIRNIRNRFAHSLGGMTFLDQKVRSWCNNIITPASRVTPVEFPPEAINSLPRPDVRPTDPREIFEEAVLLLMASLPSRQTVAHVTTRKCPTEFVHARDPFALMLRATLREQRSITTSLDSGEMSEDDMMIARERHARGDDSVAGLVYIIDALDEYHGGQH